MSLPLRECGLKSPYNSSISSQETVTPLAGVWIEIRETWKGEKNNGSLPLRECGLKFEYVCRSTPIPTSLPLRECGLKFPVGRFSGKVGESLPLRECGLKLSLEEEKDRDSSHSPCGSVD